jgi:hypothetical protein
MDSVFIELIVIVDTQTTCGSVSAGWTRRWHTTNPTDRDEPMSLVRRCGHHRGAPRAFGLVLV